MPNRLDTLTEVVENVASLDAATSGQEATDDAGDMTADDEGFRVVLTDAIYTQAVIPSPQKNERKT